MPSSPPPPCSPPKKCRPHLCHRAPRQKNAVPAFAHPSSDISMIFEPAFEGWSAFFGQVCGAWVLFGQECGGRVLWRGHGRGRESGRGCGRESEARGRTRFVVCMQWCSPHACVHEVVHELCARAHARLFACACVCVRVCVCVCACICARAGAQRCPSAMVHVCMHDMACEQYERVMW